MGTQVLWLVIVGAGAAAIGVTVGLQRRRKAVWRRFSRRNGLELVPATGDRSMAVRGRVDGRPFELTMVPHGSDRGELGVEVESMTMEADIEPPEGLCIASEPPLGTAPDDERELRSGDDALDRLALLEGADAEEVRRFLTPSRRQGLIRLLSLDDADVSGLDGRTLFVRTRRGVSRLGALEHDLCVLTAVARQLESDASSFQSC